MPPKRKLAGEENIFTWTDDESQLLLKISHNELLERLKTSESMLNNQIAQTLNHL